MQAKDGGVKLPRRHSSCGLVGRYPNPHIAVQRWPEGTASPSLHVIRLWVPFPTLVAAGDTHASALQKKEQGVKTSAAQRKAVSLGA